jgi:hypothetical protein
VDESGLGKPEDVTELLTLALRPDADVRSSRAEDEHAEGVVLVLLRLQEVLGELDGVEAPLEVVEQEDDWTPSGVTMQEAF